jgi:adenylate kinase family enzyme
LPIRELGAESKRIVIVGTSGAGKTTMAKAIASALGLPHIELDALFWEPGWRAADPVEFVARVSAAVGSDAWVLDGNYEAVRALAWARATHVIWLDFSRPVIMYRVIKRSIMRAIDQTELWSGNREDWRHWLRPSHPIIWAWTTWRQRRSRFAALLASEDYKNLIVLRFRRPQEATGVIDQLRIASWLLHFRYPDKSRGGFLRSMEGLVPAIAKTGEGRPRERDRRDTPGDDAWAQRLLWGGLTD